jgi:iron(III) transport system permease protein
VLHWNALHWNALHWGAFVALATLTLSPLVYLIYKATALPLEQVTQLLGRWVTWRRAGQSLGLVLSVLGCSWLIAGPLALSFAWLDRRAQRWVTLCALLPLMIPGYVLAYTLTALGGPYGPTAQLFGVTAPPLRGFWGATFALTLYNFPLLFLTLSAGLRQVGRARFEVARSLGLSPIQALLKAVLPSMRASSLAGSMMIGLYVLGDFGVASLMRVDTLSYAIFINWSQPSYAAWLGLLLCVQAGGALWVVWWLERGEQRGGGADEGGLPWLRVPSPWRTWLAVIIAALIAICGFLLPLSTAIFWMRQSALSSSLDLLYEAWGGAIRLGIYATLINTSVALWLALWVRRSPTKKRLFIARIGYATPPLSIALGFVFLSLSIAPVLRTGYTLLLAAYLAHSLMLALGPIQGALEQWNPQWVEAARGLGASPARTFWRITLPTLRAGVGVSIALTALSVMKELPLTKLLAPLGERTLALEAWSFADEGLYDRAAPFALCLILTSTLTALFTLSHAWRSLR